MATTETVLDCTEDKHEDRVPKRNPNDPALETGIDDVPVQNTEHVRDDESIAEEANNGIPHVRRKEVREMEDEGCSLSPLPVSEDHQIQPSFSHQTVLAGMSSSDDTGPCLSSSESVVNDNTSNPVDSSSQQLEGLTGGRQRNSVPPVSSERIQGTKAPSVDTRGYQSQLYENSDRKIEVPESICSHEKSSKCEFCEKSFHLENASNQHPVIHTVNKYFKCQFCGMTFTQKRNCKRHEMKHIGEKSFKCRYCEKSFSGKLDCIAHQMTHRAEKPFKCRFCGNSFIWKVDWKTHEMTHTGCGLSPLRVSKDEMQPSFARQMVLAGISSSDNTGPCASPREINANNDTCIQINPCIQQVKGLTSGRQRDIVCNAPSTGVQVTNELTPAINEEYQRQLSDKLNLPKRIHTHVKPFKCEFCEKTFSSKNTFNDHQLIHSSEKSFKCQFCLKSFSQKRNCKRHEMTHTGEKPFKCLICEKLFSRKQNCIIHEMTHTGEKPFKCQFCEKTFTRKGDCGTHEMIHTGEKPFKCQFCDKLFIRKQDRRKHEPTHAREKPFKCQVCEKAFSYKLSLKRHETSHTGEAPFKC